MEIKRLVGRMLLFTGLLSAAAVASGAGAQLSLNESGINVKKEGFGSITLSYPEFYDGSKKIYPIKERQISGGSAKIAYDGGGKAEVKISANTVSISFTNIPDDVKMFRVDTLLGFTSLLNGKWRIGDKEGAFPIEKPAGPMLFQGASTSFSVTVSSGASLSLKLPQYSWQQLQDNREWGWKIFAWFFNVPFSKDRPEYVVEIDPSMEAKNAQKTELIIDKFGQYTKMDWPGKVKSEEELKADVGAEKTYYAGLTPPQFDKYGGLPGSMAKFGFQKTGFFHVERKDGRWHMVDPDGNLYFHLGVCSFMTYPASVYYQGREGLFEWIPPYESEFKTAYGQNSGGGRDGQFNYLVANMIKKYGKPYDYKEWTARMIERVRKFGFNSSGAFGSGSQEARGESSFPSVPGLPFAFWEGVQELPGIARTWDPFDEKILAIVESKLSQKIPKDAEDPLIIGYSLMNEPLYENIAKVVPTYKGNFACKRRLAQMLEEKYKSIDSFNEAWGLKLASFEEVRDQGLAVKTKAAANDMNEFKKLFYETYFRFVTETFRKYDKNHMLIGCRLQSGTINDEDLCRIGGKYMDIWSFNYYTYGFDTGFLDRIYEWTGGKPMIFSEFYWNSFKDSGVPGGVRDVSSQEARGLAYRHYVEHAATMGYVVGIEWFTLVEPSYLGVGFGKYNGENPNCGLFNVVDRPYKTMIAEMVKTNYDIYKIILGDRPRFVYDDPRFNLTKDSFARNSAVVQRVSGLRKGEMPGNWDGFPAERISSKRIVDGADANGLDAAFKLCWDDENLYLLVDVNDSTPMKDGMTGADIWSCDGIELFIGSENLDKGGRLLFTDRQVLIAPSSPQGAPQCWFANSPQQYKCNIEAGLKGNGYVLKAAIPWESLAISSPKANQELLFDIGVDNSEDGKRRVCQLMWNGNGKNSGDRTWWGKLRLAGQ